MRSGVKNGVVAAAIALSLSVLSIPTLSGASTVKQPPSSVGVATNEPLPANVANAKFLNQLGQPETLGGLKGKTVMVVPLLTLCGDTCPFTSGNLLQLQALLKSAKANNVELVTISVDPYRDTVARLGAYAKLIGLTDSSDFQLWTTAGTTTTPMAPMGGSMSNGSGDTNTNLTAVEKFLGWSVQVVAQMKPVMVDWMTGKKLTYDISHSDGFWVINASQTVRFASGTAPAFKGTIAKKLATFMDSKSNIYTVGTPNPKGWTPAEALQALSWVAGTQY
jgi:cytochrome oxidase Cu insertion factor (SCO1/SenC/PrrC family)